MPTTVTPSSHRSQLPLSSGNGVSIIPVRKSKCPSCGQLDSCPTIRTVQADGATVRDRYCSQCKFHFQTEEKRPELCPHCDSDAGFWKRKTERIRGGIFRLLRCKQCSKYVKTMEPFPNLHQRTSKDFTEWRP